MTKYPMLALTLLMSGCAIRQPVATRGIDTPPARAVKALADLPATSQYGVWRPLGPSNYGGKVYDLAVDPRNANVVFAAYGAGGEIGTTNGGGLWRTLNGGESWAPAVDRARDTGFLCVKAHPKVAGYLAAGLRSISYNQDRGVLLSTDGGVTWQSIGPPDPTLSVNDIALNPNDPDTLYAATQNLLLKTVDRGKSWKVLLSYTTPALWADLPTIIMHPNDPQTLLLAQRSLGVVRSSDGGATWTRVDTDWDQNDRQTMLAWSPSDGNIVYAERVLPQRVKEDGATRQMAMYRSADAGRTWTRMSVREAYHQERYDMSLAVDPTDSNRVIVANTEMIISTDGLRTFASPYNRPHDDHLRTVFAPSDPKIVYNGNDGGVWKSADRGFGWVRADHDVETTHVFSFAVAGDSGMIYLSAGDYDGMFYHSQFGWHDLGCGDEFQQFFVNPHDPSDVYVGSPLRRVGGPSAICAEIDPAKSEIRLTHQAMAFDPVDANTIYLGLEHIWKSQDRGAHWHSIGINEKAAGLHQPIVALQVAPGAANMIYALVGGSGDLWFSPDGGADWSSGFQVPAPTALAVSPRDAHTVYLGSALGLYVSHDGGKSGALLDAFPPMADVYRIVIDPADPSRVFVGSNNGVLVSGDAGASWSRLGSGLPKGTVVDLSLVNRTLYASSNQGLWSMDLSGRAPCDQPFHVTPSGSLRLGSAGGVMFFDVDAVPGCKWTATTGVDWAEIHPSWATAELRIGTNTGDTRETTLTIAGKKVRLTQLGGPDPIHNAATITISRPEGCLTSAGDNKLTLASCNSSAAQQFALYHSRDFLYVATSGDSGTCWDMKLSGKAGETLYLYPCHGHDHQLFQFVPERDGMYSIFITTGRQCLEARGDHLEQQDCNGGDAQKFRVK